MKPYYRAVAEEMLGVDELPMDLESRLANIEAMIKTVKPNGNLSSTQVIAAAILQWKFESSVE